jgi:hypothetical protein
MIGWIIVAIVWMLVIVLFVKRLIGFVIEKLNEAEEEELKELSEELAKDRHKNIEKCKNCGLVCDGDFTENNIKDPCKIEHEFEPLPICENHGKDTDDRRFFSGQCKVCYRKLPAFTCYVCRKKHNSPGINPKNGAWLFPNDTATTIKNAVCCIECVKE